MRYVNLVFSTDKLVRTIQIHQVPLIEAVGIQPQVLASQSRGMEYY